MNASLSDAITSFMGLISGGFITTSAVIFVVLAAMIWHRTRSTHMLMSRLWTLFNGKVKCANATINHILEERSAVMQFRFLTKLHVRTPEQAEAVRNWSEVNREDLDRIAACGDYFDLEGPSLKPLAQLPRAWFFALLSALVAITIMGMAVSIFGMVTDRALVQMKSSKTWFTLDSVSVKHLNGGPAFLLSKCNTRHADLAASSEFSVADIDLICAAADANEVPEFVRASVHSQRYAFGFILAISIYFFLPFFSELRKAHAALAMHKRLQIRAH